MSSNLRRVAGPCPPRSCRWGNRHESETGNRRIQSDPTTLVRPGGLILAHNINPRQADPKFIKAITTNPQLETVLTQMHTAGISVTMKKR